MAHRRGKPPHRHATLPRPHHRGRPPADPLSCRQRWAAHAGKRSTCGHSADVHLHTFTPGTAASRQCLGCCVGMIARPFDPDVLLALVQHAPSRLT